MFRAFLSWRYLIARRTNVIGVLGLWIAVGALIVILAIMTGFLEHAKEMVRGDLADVIVEPKFRPRDNGKLVEPEPEELLRAVREDPRVAAATPRLTWFAVFGLGGERVETTMEVIGDSNFSDLAGVQLVGVDVRTQDKLFGIARALALRSFGLPASLPQVQDELDTTTFYESLLREPRGGWRPSQVDDPLFPFAPPPGYRPQGRSLGRILVGATLMRQLGLRRGQIVSLMTVVGDPETGELHPNNREFVIAGAFSTGKNEIDQGRLYLDRRELEDFVGGTRSFGQVLVRLRDYDEDAQAVRLDLFTTLDSRGLIYGSTYGGEPTEIETWEDSQRALLGAIRNERALLGIMLSLVLLVAGFTVFAILSMMVTEKQRDIGILTAVGATPRGILSMFLMIGFWDALIGATMGTLSGVWIALEIDPIERWLSGLFGVTIFDRTVYLFDHIPSRVEPLSVTIIVVGAFLSTLLFAAIPAWRAARLDPLESLRYE